MSEGESRSCEERARFGSAMRPRIYWRDRRRGGTIRRVGMFDFFRKRRERESAVPGGEMPESLKRQLQGDGGTVGQPIGHTPQQGFDFSGGADLGSVLGMMQQAFQSGNYEINIDQAEGQTIDMRGTGLRDEILEAMRQHGIDPENATAQGQINAADYQGLQEQILQALRNHGVDVSGANGGMQISGGDKPTE
jgi:hypothetical protein